MLSRSDFDLRDIGREKTALFIKIHDEKTTYHALATILVKQIYESLIEVAQTEEGNKLKIRIIAPRAAVKKLFACFKGTFYFLHAIQLQHMQQKQLR